MEKLTPEQLKKIEENKKAALLKKQQKNPSNKPEFAKNKPEIKPNIFKKSNDSSKSFFSEGIVNNSGSPVISGHCKLIRENRFIIEMQFHGPTVDIFKTIDGRKYDANTKKWSFPISEHGALMKNLAGCNNIKIDPLPRFILDSFKSNSNDTSNCSLDLSKIDETLYKTLLPFQEEGIRFGISKNGRCLLADDMGLGKTIQALGIAHYYKENWPLLIVCPSSMRFPWEEAIQTFLPSVNPFQVTVLTSSKDLISEYSVVILSYDLMKTCLEMLRKKKFGVIILDESHFLKSYKSVRTKASLELTAKAQRVILLSGTPALSRPIELYTQISAVSPNAFKSLHEFGLRYCDGKKDRFGWNFNGSSNVDELDLLLRKQFMIRRLKTEVITQLPSKLRKLVVLHPQMVKAITKQIKDYTNKLEQQKGMERRSTLLSFYCLTGSAKLPAVCEYLQDKLECQDKFLVFAHHKEVLNGITDLLLTSNVDFIRIDGSTPADTRKVLCDKFQNEIRCRVAVLSIKAANSGITLTAAQLVIFAELFWNPGELTQAEDRAHRIGQQDSVVVEYLLAKGTADDYLWKLIQSKLDVLNKAGLSKDNFKNTNTELMVDKKQESITTYFESFQKQPLTDSETEKFDQIRHDFLEKVDDDDDLFANLDLEGGVESKKRKIN